MLCLRRQFKLGSRWQYFQICRTLDILSLIFRYLNDKITSSNVPHRILDDRETAMKIAFEM